MSALQVKNPGRATMGWFGGGGGEAAVMLPRVRDDSQRAGAEVVQACPWPVMHLGISTTPLPSKLWRIDALFVTISEAKPRRSLTEAQGFMPRCNSWQA